MTTQPNGGYIRTRELPSLRRWFPRLPRAGFFPWLCPIWLSRAARGGAQGNLEEAEGWLRRALHEAIEGFGDNTPHVAAAKSNIAECLRLRGKFAEAEPLYLEV